MQLRVEVKRFHNRPQGLAKSDGILRYFRRRRPCDPRPARAGIVELQVVELGRRGQILDPQRGAFAIALQSCKTHMPVVRKIPSERLR